MKKIIALLLTLLLCLSMAACGGGTREDVTVLPDGTKRTITSDKQGNILSELVEKPDGSTHAFTYHEDGSDCEKIEYPDGSSITVTNYADGSWSIQEKNLDGSSIENIYYADGSHVETGTEANGAVHCFTFDENGICLSEIGTLADGTAYEIYFDQEGNIVSEVRTPPEGADGTVSENEQEQNDTSVTGDGRVYDENGNYIEVIPGDDGSVIEHIYNINGNHTEIYTAPDGSVYTHQYDENGNHISETVTMADGSYDEFQYDANGNVINEVHK